MGMPSDSGMCKHLNELTVRLEAQLHRCLPTLKYIDTQSDDIDPGDIAKEKAKVIGARLWLAVSPYIDSRRHESG